MNYHRHYDLLITRARNRKLEGYLERHHIIPKCIGGTDEAENIVSLTAEEHYLAHQLLVKIHPGVKGLVFATMAMCGKGRTKARNNKSYGWLRKLCSEARQGFPLSNEHKRKISEGVRRNPGIRTGVPQPESFKKAHSERMKGNAFNVGRKWSPEVIAKRAESNRKTQTGKELSTEHKAALKKAADNPLTYIRRCVSQATYQARKNLVPFSEIK